MRKWMLAAGAAALAIGGPALADPKGDRGGGRAQAAQAQKGGGQAKAANQVRAGRGDSDRGRAVRVAQRDDDRARGGGQARARVRDDRQERRVEARGTARANQDRDRDRDRVVTRGRDDDRRVVAQDRDRDRRAIRGTRIFDNDDARIVRRSFDFDPFPGRGRGLIAGCPPGLDKKDNGCMPPGQLKNLLGARLPASFANSLVPLSQRSWFRDDDDFLFRSGDGFIYRVDRDDGLIDGIIPMFGSGYYALGDPWPSPYNFYNVPYQYRSLYADRGDDCYRYDGFGAIYRVDCDRGVVNSIVALLAGDLGVGSRLPLGYDAYNVPLAYRPTYFDTPTALYRYNDGYIYRVDPTTRLITAVIDALV